MNRKKTLRAKDIERLENTSVAIINMVIDIDCAAMTCPPCTDICSTCERTCDGSCGACSGDCTNNSCGCTEGCTATCLCTDVGCTAVTCNCEVSLVCCETI